METAFHTLQDFMLFTKGSAYLLMGMIVPGMLGFWLYLTSRDEENNIK